MTSCITFAAYLGAVVSPSPHWLRSAVLGLICLFLPGVLILIGTLPFWEGFVLLTVWRAPPLLVVIVSGSEGSPWRRP